MDVEFDGFLPFLNVLLCKLDDGSLSHCIFHKKTHTDQYLRVSSHHFPAQKFGFFNTLATWALRISDVNHLGYEKSHLLKVFEKNGYSKHQGLKYFQRACKGHRIKKTFDGKVSLVKLPFIHGTTDKIAHILKKHKVLATFNPLSTIKISLRFFKDPVDPRDMKGVYSITCSYGIPYIGEIDHSIKLRIQEHVTDIRQKRSCTSTISKHAEKTMHHVCIEDSQVTTRINHLHHKKLREAIEIEKHATNLNRYDGWKLSKNWVLDFSSDIYIYIYIYTHIYMSLSYGWLWP